MPATNFSHDPRREILCRGETFGGTLFHPDDATFVQLDHEAFACAIKVFKNGILPNNEQERELIAQLTQILPSTDRPFRVTEFETIDRDLVPGQLSAPILVDFQITERCGLGCPQCYASSVVKGKDVSWEDTVLAVTQMREAGVCQVAIGGGEPVYHPRLADMLELIRDNGMVPNLTTTGLSMTEIQLRSMVRNCGAVAMSLEAVDERFALRRRQGFATFRATAQRFLNAGIPLVMQATVSSENLVDIDSIVEFCLELPGLYGVIFLAHKPAGRAVGYDRPLASLPYANVHATMTRAIERLNPHTRVGFDCCFSPGLVGIERELGHKAGTIVEGCSATVSGLGLTPSLDILPCTFLTDRKLGNLREKHLMDIWRDATSRGFRTGMKKHSTAHTACQSCSMNSSCKGGCSAWALVGCITKEPLVTQLETEFVTKMHVRS